ncbi:hypothetical protein GGI17_001702 [Coemansia sp. S146]|nr:hypothetical protein GGI17_001702 [Coemansia sp. S146]
MADDNTDNNMSNNDGVDCGGLQTEQSFETLLYSANHNRTPEDYESAQMAMEKRREALTAKWAARLIGKTLVGAEPVPVFAPCENDVEDDEHNADNNEGEAEAEAGDNGSGDEYAKAGDVAEESYGIAEDNIGEDKGDSDDKVEREESDNVTEDNIASTTDADIDKNSVAGTGDDYEAEEDKEDSSEVEDSDFDGGSDDRFFSLASLPANRRILYGQNAPMTMDYRPDRLNVVLDDNGVCIEVFFV